MELFRIGFLSVTLIDILDVLAIFFIFYKLYQVMRGTRAAQMFLGLIIILFVYIIVLILNMSGMLWLIQSVATVWVIAFVIIFQPELRRGLTQLGQSRLLRRVFRIRGSRVIEEVVRAAKELSQKKYGGLIVLQGDTGLRGIMETGIKIQSEVSTELLVSIFSPLTPMHDGAVIIGNDLVLAAKCILPLTGNPRWIKALGTRHQAALGISEESDATAVVISEETGKISLTKGGKLIRNLSPELLGENLYRMFSIQKA
ncbi:TIGR00159 family protein [candidate division KSB1 bacterium]|nr:TIGR00159 family protein [candidate division KSB1 bacterium]